MEIFGANIVWLSSPEIQGALITSIIAVLIELGRRRLTAKAKIKWGISHGHRFFIRPTTPKPSAAPNTHDVDGESDSKGTENSQVPPQKGTGVDVQQIWIQNVGRATAKDLNVILNFPPQNFNIWPVLEYSVHENPDSRLVLKIKELHKRQYFTISILEVNGVIPDVLSVGWSEGAAKEVLMGPQQIFAPWVGGAIVFFAAFGLAAVLYFGFNILGFYNG